MEEINVETVRAALTDANPVLEALGVLLKEVSADAVASLQAVLGIVGLDPKDMPGEFLIQSVLVESEKVFKSIDRESWIKIYDSYQAVKAVIDANPELKTQITQKHEATVDSLLDGNF